ncbi:MAG TPA: acyl-CoA synthetase [Arenicellales bacterium]|jgi:fatty-acyl-CoA synthase|nr:acyl-CoA synthetase [Acidiferrobacteraceae bacterium]MDP7219495.1 acyl-CoA synthetase [Arenicellales bacterium]HJP09141.1 acyl-CoA synthetase [Arenicellales bacterium]|tara:strand:+ start:20070 stop:21692 length:1623 start_codon:yes stop_codon:yes gene_type:complete
MSIFNDQLDQNEANFAPLSPVSFLRRAAQIAPGYTAIIHGERRYTYHQFWERSCRLASALTRRGIGPGDCVAIMAANTPEMLEAHNGIPMVGAVLNSLNFRLDAGTIAFILEHGQARVLITDRAFSSTIGEALQKIDRKLLVIDIDDPTAPEGDLLGETDYESLLAEGEAVYHSDQPDDEWQALSLLYTSGTTGNPKGCVYHHRGGYLNALGNMNTMGLTRESVYLWTLPMFHCDGWTFTWGVTAAMATHVCLREIDPAMVFRLIRDEKVSHMCGAPVVLNMLAHAPESAKTRFAQRVEIATGGAAPPSSVIEAMEDNGFNVTHLYGLTETYGPATVCLPQTDWPELAVTERSARIARQGVHYATLEGASVKDPQTMKDVPWDGQTMGEVMIRGNTVMKGYLKNSDATKDAFSGGWFHSGDLAVRHSDSYIEVKDRSKDVIISGGENISSLEIEETLYRHPAVLEAAVVARPDDKWGETPCAFVTLHQGQSVTADAIIEFCREHLAGYKTPRTVIFGALPKTSTGKIQKFMLREQAESLC